MSADVTADVTIPTGNREDEIQIYDLHKSFGDLEVLKGIDLVVHRGEVVCVIGPSGSGKSTLLRCVNLLEQPTRAGSSSSTTRLPTRTPTSTTSAP